MANVCAVVDRWTARVPVKRVVIPQHQRLFLLAQTIVDSELLIMWFGIVSTSTTVAAAVAAATDGRILFANNFR